MHFVSKMNQAVVTELQPVNEFRFSLSIFRYSVPIAVHITYLVFEQLLFLTSRLIYVANLKCNFKTIQLDRSKQEIKEKSQLAFENRHLL